PSRRQSRQTGPMYRAKLTPLTFLLSGAVYSHGRPSSRFTSYQLSAFSSQLSAKILKPSSPTLQAGRGLVYAYQLQTQLSLADSRVLTADSSLHTRLFFGGRQPLCGIG